MNQTHAGRAGGFRYAFFRGFRGGNDISTKS
jgi:hypothetical protein